MFTINSVSYSVRSSGRCMAQVVTRLENTRAGGVVHDLIGLKR